MSSKIQSIPAHRHEFIKIIEIAITKFIEKCEMKFKGSYYLFYSGKSKLNSLINNRSI